MRAVAAFRSHQRKLRQLSRYGVEFGEPLNSDYIYDEVGFVINFEEYEKRRFGGIVERIIRRMPIGNYKDIPVEDIEFNQAAYELSEYAEISRSAELYKPLGIVEGRTQVGYLERLDDVFHHPSRKGALADLFDAGCEIRTRKAVYKMVKRSVK